jgi:hypothetical protein
MIGVMQVMDFTSRQVQALYERSQAHEDNTRNQYCSVRVSVAGGEK